MGPDISTLISDFLSASTADLPNRARRTRNTLAVAGIEGSSYNAQDIAQLIANGAHPDEYPFLQKYARGIAGVFLANGFDPKFAARSEKDLDAVMLSDLTELYMANKDMGSWKVSEVQCIFDGGIYRGVEEIYIERPDIGDPQSWYVSFRPVRSDSIIFDPAINDNRISRSSKRCWRFSYPRLEEIVMMYPGKEEEIKEYYRAKQHPSQSDVYDKEKSIHNAYYDAYESCRNNKYQVVEFYKIENRRMKRARYVPTAEDIPLNGEQYGTEKSFEIIGEWLLSNGYSLNKEDIMSFSAIEQVLMITVFIPDLQLVLDQGPDERQLGGHLPFYAWSWLEIDGQSIGVVDSLWSSNRDFHKREQAKTKHFEQTPVAKGWYHANLFDGNQAEEQKFIQNWSDPSVPVKIPDDIPYGTEKHAFGMIPGGEIPNVFQRDQQDKIAQMDNLSGLTPSMQGSTERSGESARHYTSKVIEGNIQQRVPQEFLIEHKKDKVTDWLKLAPKVYGGLANVNRQFRSHKDSKRFITTNEFEGYDNSGKPKLKNDLSKLKRIDVVIGKAPESDIVKLSRRASDIEASQMIAPNAINGEALAILQGNIILNGEFRDESERKRAEEAVERMLELAQLQSEASIAGFKAQKSGSEYQYGTSEIQKSLLSGQEEIQNKTQDVQYQNLVVQEQQLGGAVPPQQGPAPQSENQQPVMG